MSKSHKNLFKDNINGFSKKLGEQKYTIPLNYFWKKTYLEAVSVSGNA